MQGWNPDPFGRFEHRYFSNDTPTNLVRTGALEGRDEPGLRSEPEVSLASVASGREEPPALRPWLYERRPRESRMLTVLAAAFFLPFVGWELLVTTLTDRLFGAVAFAIVAATLTVFIRAFRGPDHPRARLSACDSRPSTSSTEPRTPSR
jgi:hypothetical protein